MTATEGSNSGLGFDTQDVPSFQPQIPSLFSVHQALEQLKTDGEQSPSFTFVGYAQNNFDYCIF
jgi:hypothetical protein